MGTLKQQNCRQCLSHPLAMKLKLTKPNKKDKEKQKSLTENQFTRLYRFGF